MKITKKEFEVLFNIPLGKTDLERGYKSDNKFEKVILKLEKKGLIRIEYREGKIYGFMLSKKGEISLKDSSYKEWADEFEG